MDISKAKSFTKSIAMVVALFFLSITAWAQTTTNQKALNDALEKRAKQFDSSRQKDSTYSLIEAARADIKRMIQDVEGLPSPIICNSKHFVIHDEFYSRHRKALEADFELWKKCYDSSNKLGKRRLLIFFPSIFKTEVELLELCRFSREIIKKGSLDLRAGLLGAVTRIEIQDEATLDLISYIFYLFGVQERDADLRGRSFEEYAYVVRQFYKKQYPKNK